MSVYGNMPRKQNKTKQTEKRVIKINFRNSYIYFDI